MIGQRGLYTTSSGLQLAYLSGCYEESEYKKTSTDNTKLVSTYNNTYSIEYMYIHVSANIIWDAYTVILSNTSS